MQGMGWDVEFTSEFEFWWMALDELAQDAIDRAVHLLEGRGPPSTPGAQRSSSLAAANLVTTSSTNGWSPSRIVCTTSTWKRSREKDDSRARRSDMAKNFNELRDKMPPERRRQNAAAANRMLLEMTLQELRQDITHFSQEDVAELLQVTQGYISKLERQDDMLLSNLYAYVEALGGQVEIRAKFPNQEVQINQFREVEKLKAALAPKAKRDKLA
jgi:predicted XRE-type DNA-binding protein